MNFGPGVGQVSKQTKMLVAANKQQTNSDALADLISFISYVLLK